MAPVQEQIRELLDKLDPNQARWVFVAVGVVILLRLRLVLFAAALPLMVYWHYSQQGDEAQQVQPGEAGFQHDQDGDAQDNDGGHGGWGDEMDDEGFDMCGDDRKVRAAAAEEATDPYDKEVGTGRTVADGNDGDASIPKAAARSAPWHKEASTDAKNPPPDQSASAESALDRDLLSMFGDDDKFGLGGLGGGEGKSSSRMGGLGGTPGGCGEDRDPFGSDSFGLGPLEGLGSGGDLGSGGGGLDDFDFLGAGGGGGAGFDVGDFGGFGGFGGGDNKGKGKGKKGGKGKDYDPNAPREANPKQVFVANVGEMEEDELRAFFEEVGDIDRLKLLRDLDGSPKGVCFVTFREVEQAQKALSLHGTSLNGKTLTVRPANSGSKGKGEDKGGGKGGGGFGDRDRDRDRNRDRDRSDVGPVDLGGSERFGAAFGFGADRQDRDRDFRGGMGGSKGGKGKGRAGNERREMDELLEEALRDHDGPLEIGDFDFAARRFLSELKTRDRENGTNKLQEAIEMVLKYTGSKDRSSVRKWAAYVYKLLQNFDPVLGEEMRSKDAERRQQKGFGGKGRFSDDGPRFRDSAGPRDIDD